MTTLNKVNKALKKACIKEDLDGMKSAFDQGADINAPLFENNINALLYFARLPEKNRLLEQLIALGADLEHNSSMKNTALHYAAMCNRYGNVCRLLEAGSEIRKKNLDNKTALDLAENYENIKIAELIRKTDHDRNNYNGFVRESSSTVSMVENFEFSQTSLRKAFNFATQEVTTFAKAGVNIQQFNEISNKKRLEEAAEALKALGGDPGDWKPQKPGVLSTKQRIK
jgi:ankyrin repeat protein